MNLVYAIINEDSQVIDAFVGNVLDIQEELNQNKCKAIQVTVENSPIHQFDYYDGSKFVKEKPNGKY